MAAERGERGRWSAQLLPAPLPRGFYSRETCEVAQDLIGKLLVRIDGPTVAVGKIVEVEAYKGLSDPASHAYRGNRGRASIMFGEVGHAYVYFTYGSHFCLNVAAKHPRARAGAVLLRAAQPLTGMRYLKNKRGNVGLYRVASGPGNLARAFGVDGSFYGVDMTSRGPLYIGCEPRSDVPAVACSARIGLSRATRRRWRFFEVDNQFVSHYLSTRESK